MFLFPDFKILINWFTHSLNMLLFLLIITNNDDDEVFIKIKSIGYISCVLNRNTENYSNDHHDK